MLKNFLVTSFRNLTRSKTYFLLGITGLSLGIGCVIALHTIVSFQSNYDVHQSNFDNIYRVIGDYKFGTQEVKTATVPHPFSSSLKDEVVGIAAMTNMYFHVDQVNVPLPNGELKKIKQEGIAFAYDEIYEILDFNWKAGKVNGDKKAVYLSTSTARKLFDISDSYNSIIGRTIVLGNVHTLQVAGVYEDFPEQTDFPFEMVTYYENQRTLNPYFGMIWQQLNGSTNCIFKIDPHADPAQIRKSLKAAYEKFEPIEGYNVDIQPLSAIHTGSVGNYSGINFENQYRVICYTLAAFLAIIGCINFINLTTARAVKRAKETGIRKVMGSSRTQLLIQYLTESFVMVLLSLIIGYMLAHLILDLLDSVLGRSMSVEIVPVSEWILFSIGMVIAITLLAGLYPAVVLSKFSPLTAIKIKLNNVDRQSRLPVRKILVGLQFGFSISLIIGTIVIFSQMKFMKGYDMGFHSDGIVNLRFPVSDYEKQTRLKNQVLNDPLFQKASLNLSSPLGTTNNIDRYHTGALGKEQQVNFNVKAVDQDYLDLFDITLLSGRNIRNTDPEKHVLVSESAVKKLNLGSNEDALGKELIASWGTTFMVVGVIEDFHTYTLDNEIIPIILKNQKNDMYELSVKLSSAGKEDLAASMLSLEKHWNAVYPEVLIEYDFLDAQIAEKYAFHELMGKSIGFFVVIALVISILGLYGLTDYMANSKRKEIGIRKVAGAEVRQILKLFVKEVTYVIGIAFIIAGTATYFLMNAWLNEFAYRIPIGIEVFGLALIATALITIFTMGYRSYIAARINPVMVLKDE